MEKQKNIPVLRFPEFDGEWEKPELNKKMEIFRGASPRPKGDPRYYKGDIPRLMIEDATRDGKYVFPSIDSLTEEGAKKSRLLKKGSFVLSCSGTKVGIPTILGVDACIHDGWIGFKNFKNVYNEFLYYIFLKLYDRIQGKATTGGVFNNLTTSILRELKLGFPSYPEQQKIATFFTAIDQKISQLKKKHQLLEQYKKGVMQKIFSQQIRFKDDDGREFPKWEKKRLGEISVKKASTISANTIDENFGEYPVYGATGFLKCVDFYIESNDYISIVKDGAGVGRLLYCKGNSSVLGTLDIIKPKAGLNTFFLYLLLSQIDFTKFITGSTIPHIYFKDYSKTILPIPIEKEQTKIANFLSAIDDKIHHTQKQIEQAEQWKKGLMQKMFV